MLNSNTVSDILMAKVSETTGQLAEPIKRYYFTATFSGIFIFFILRNRVAERSSAISRVAKPTIGSPVIFSSSGSPLKEFLDSPLTRQVAKHTRQIEEKNNELRELKVELDRERMEKQFLAEENSQVKTERRRMETDITDLKTRLRDLTEGTR